MKNNPMLKDFYELTALEVYSKKERAICSKLRMQSFRIQIRQMILRMLHLRKRKQRLQRFLKQPRLINMSPRKVHLHHFLRYFSQQQLMV